MIDLYYWTTPAAAAPDETSRAVLFGQSQHTVRC